MRASFDSLGTFGALVLSVAAATTAHGQAVGGAPLAPHEPLAPAPRTKVMGTWSGTAVDPLGESYPFHMTLAQMGPEVYGIGTMTVDPSNPLFGRPSVRLRGTAGSGLLHLGVSGLLNNACSEASTSAYDAEVLYDPATETLVTLGVTAQTAVGCGQLFAHFEVARLDEPYTAGNTSLLGTWKGRVDGPYGWIFAPPVLTPPRKSFFLSARGTLKGFFESRPEGPWGELNLTWDPATGRAEYAYECVTIYTLAGLVDGNKLSGVAKYTGVPDDDFYGVFVHTLQPVFIQPGPAFAPFCPWTDD